MKIQSVWRSRKSLCAYFLLLNRALRCPAQEGTDVIIERLQLKCHDANILRAERNPLDDFGLWRLS